MTGEAAGMTGKAAGMTGKAAEMTKGIAVRGSADPLILARVLSPIQIWIPDVRWPAFRAEAHRQSLAIATSPHAGDDQAFIDAVSDCSDEEAETTFGQSTAARTVRASRAPSSLFKTMVST
jgi:antidote-toxin recognition MazE-like antitoxin